MTVGLASGLVNGWLDTDFGTIYVQLHKGDPGSAGTSNAATGDTSRKNPTMSSASGGSKAMSGTVGPWTNSGATETLSHISLWTASTSGTFKASAALTASQAWVSTNTFTLSSLSVAITPIAA